MRIFKLNNIDEIESDRKKCDYCNHTVSCRFLGAESVDEAVSMTEGNGPDGMVYNGFCGGCMSELVATNASLTGDVRGYELIAEEDQ